MQQHEQSIKAAIDSYVVLAGVAAFIGDIMPTLALVLAAILSLIRIVNEWPQLRKTIRGWFRK